MDAVKPFKTYDEQVDILAQRGLIIADREAARQVLTHQNYYRISAYHFPLQDAKDHFRPGSTFEQLVALYRFDHGLRLLVSEACKSIEISLRARWSHVVAEAHGPQGYEDVALVKDRCRHTANLYSLDRELERSKEVFVKHYRQQYGMARPPIWAAAEVMSFGLLSRFYANLAVSSLRKDIAQTYDFAPDAFESLVHHIVYLRNLCAHHARLWNREFVVTVKLPRKRPAEVVSCLNPEKDRRLYNSLILLDHFANVVDPSSDWRQRLSAHLLTLPAGSLADMGFPQDQCPPFSAQQPIPSR